MQTLFDDQGQHTAFITVTLSRTGLGSAKDNPSIFLSLNDDLASMNTKHHGYEIIYLPVELSLASVCVCRLFVFFFCSPINAFSYGKFEFVLRHICNSFTAYGLVKYGLFDQSCALF